MEGYHANQSLLHTKLKAAYAIRTDGQQEYSTKVGINSYRIDVFDETKNTAYEIQLDNFGTSFYEKIRDLIKIHDVVVVHPIPIIQQVRTIGESKPRVIHKRNDFYTIFEKLVSFRVEFCSKKLSFELLKVEERIERKLSGYRRRGRPKYKLLSRDLVRVIDKREVEDHEDIYSFLPENLPSRFTNKDLMEGLEIKGGRRRRKKIAACMSYSLRNLGIIEKTGKQGRFLEFKIACR